MLVKYYPEISLGDLPTDEGYCSRGLGVIKVDGY